MMLDGVKNTIIGKGGSILAAATGQEEVAAGARVLQLAGIGETAAGAYFAKNGMSNMKKDSMKLAKLEKSGGGNTSTSDGGSKPPNLSPEGAGRNGAFREAKKNSGIPVTEQPKKVTPAVDKRGNRIPGKDYDFGDGKVIRNHSGGHKFPDNPSQNRGPHFNDPKGNHYDY